MQIVKHFAEDALMWIAIRMSDEHVHVATRGFPTPVRATRHHQQLRIHAVCRFLYLPVKKRAK